MPNGSVGGHLPVDPTKDKTDDVYFDDTVNAYPKTHLYAKVKTLFTNSHVNDQVHTINTQIKQSFDGLTKELTGM